MSRYFQVKFGIDLYSIYNEGKMKIKTNVSVLKLILKSTNNYNKLGIINNCNDVINIYITHID